MIRRLVLFALFLLAATFTYASATDTLVTAGGTLYSVDSVYVDPTMGLDTTSSSVLVLTTQTNGVEQTQYIPASLAGGINWTPSLAYDNDSQSLFVFWQRMPNLMSSELLFCSYQNGVWSDPTSIDNAPYHFRLNLSIAITRQIEQVQTDGTSVYQPLLAVHAVWWDETGTGESARYAMLELSGGTVTSIQIHDLTEFTGANENPQPMVLDGGYDADLFRQPTVMQVPGSRDIEIIFGDFTKNRFERVDLHLYTPDGVLHLPVGRFLGELDPPLHNVQDAVSNFSQSNLTVLSAPGSSSLVFSVTESTGLEYVLYKDGAWSATPSNIVVSGNVSQDASLNALRKLASE